jgi:hypothetical protein
MDKREESKNATDANSENSVSIWKVIAILFIVVIVFSIIVGVVGMILHATNNRNSSTQINKGTSRQIPWNEKTNSQDAYYISQEMIAEMLVSPSSAEFPSYTSGNVHVEKVVGTQMYVVGSYVEAKNRLGVDLRQYFMITVEQTGPTTWKLVKFEWK